MPNDFPTPDPKDVSEITTWFNGDKVGKTTMNRIASRTTPTRTSSQYALALRFEHIFRYLTPTEMQYLFSAILNGKQVIHEEMKALRVKLGPRVERIPEIVEEEEVEVEMEPEPEIIEVRTLMTGSGPLIRFDLKDKDLDVPITPVDDAIKEQQRIFDRILKERLAASKLYR